MSRKRKKKRKSNDKGADALQVELLQDNEAAQAPAEVTPEAVALESAPEPRESRDAGDRWAKAVGQLKPSPPGERSRPEDERPKSTRPAVPEAEAEGGASPDAQPPNQAKIHVTARDHAAASAVRPAGEPLARARDLVERGRIQEAIELYLGILTVNPSNLKAHNNLGVLFDELKQFESALEHFEAAERLGPDNVEVLANFASTLTSLARYEAAEDLLRRALRLSPEDIQARLGIGVLSFRRGLYDQAESELAWVCARDESNGAAYYYRGEALNRLSRFDEAATSLERAIELSPSDPRPFYTLGHLYDRGHRLEDAAEMYRRSRQLQGL